jgi:hypothetical protein
MRRNLIQSSLALLLSTTLAMAQPTPPPASTEPAPAETVQPAAPHPTPAPQTAAPATPVPATSVPPTPAPPTPAPPHALAPAAPAPTPPPAVLPAEQLASAELTGMLGHPVVSAEGAELGVIVDLLVDAQGRVRAVVVDVGGFMGVGSRKVAVAWSALRFAEGKTGPVISIEIPPDRIKSWADYIAGRPVAILGTPGASQ